MWTQQYNWRTIVEEPGYKGKANHNFSGFLQTHASSSHMLYYKIRHLNSVLLLLIILWVSSHFNSCTFYFSLLHKNWHKWDLIIEREKKTFHFNILFYIIYIYMHIHTHICWA